jgi:hypothetical protein
MRRLEPGIWSKVDPGTPHPKPFTGLLVPQPGKLRQQVGLALAVDEIVSAGRLGLVSACPMHGPQFNGKTLDCPEIEPPCSNND